jgi:hypothetical protein
MSPFRSIDVPDYPNITPEEAARRGLRSFDAKRSAQMRNFKAVNAAGERYADAMGWRIIGKYDHQGQHKRTFFCQP